MNTNSFITASQARKDLFGLISSVNSGGKVSLTVKGPPLATLISYDELESMQDTLELLSDQNWCDDMKKADKEFDSGETLSWDVARKSL